MLTHCTTAATAHCTGRTSVSFVELTGDACSDMLNGGKPLRLVTGADGYTHPHPAVEPQCESAEDLIALIKVCSAICIHHW